MIFRSKKKTERIEPQFDASDRRRPSDELRVGEDDRTLPSAARPAPRKTQNAAASRSAGPAKPAPRRKPAAKAKPKRSFFWRFTGKAVYWGIILAIWGGIGIAGIVGYYGSKLPSSASWAIPERPPNARIVSRDGELIANRGKTGGASMRLNEMSPYIPMAVIAIEDRRFRQHFGFDPIGFTRAMATNVMAGRLVQGGSTLTQQLAKNMFLEPERTIERKVQELILALWLETQYSKDEILELYLNRVYFGSGAYGVDAASRRYFQKSARDVNLAEAALLAGLLKAPSRLSPARNPELAEERSQLVLASMRREGFISDREAAKALSQEATKAKRYWSGSEHYAADLVMKEINDVFGDITQDVIVETTLDLKLQTLAGQAIEQTLATAGKERKVGQGALVSMAPNGAIRALVGGREYADSQFNRATEAKRQPGSAFKPIVYLAALEAGRTPQSVRQDLPVKIGNWTPVNYDRKYRGPVTLDTALAKSLNTIAAQMVMEVGPQTVVSTAKRLGIHSGLQPNASISLGTSEVTLLELTGAFAPFSNGGYYVEPYLIRRIKDMEGKVLYERSAIPDTLVVREREVGMINHMLANVVTSGTGRNAALGPREVAGKTGTSQKSRDGLFIGYTADLVTGVWFGNDDGSPMSKVTGGSLPATSWHEFMAAAHEGLPLTPLPGNYVPEPVTASIPQLVPNSGNGSVNGGRERSIGQILEQERPSDRRRSLSEIDGGVRPPANIGQEQERPRNILDLLFGRN